LAENVFLFLVFISMETTAVCEESSRLRTKAKEN